MEDFSGEIQDTKKNRVREENNQANFEQIPPF
jgi:hypothetical protein